MRNEKLRKAIDEYGKQHDLTIKLLDNQAYDDSIIGLTGSGVVVYDYDSMVHELAKEDGFDEQSAIEWIDYNTLRAIPYFGEGAPIIIEMGKDVLMDFYGEE